MATVRDKLPHEDRTFRQPRTGEIHTVILDRVEKINDHVRLFKFEIKDPKGIKFLAGQWLDTFVPGLPKAGGFTITSTPSDASPLPPGTTPREDNFPFLELAIQKSPENPPAAWLWRDPPQILGQEVRVRVGGSFVWPPLGIDVEKDVERVVFVAGGVGINPLMSMLSQIRQEASQKQRTPKISFLYTFKNTTPPPTLLTPLNTLFLPRLQEIATDLGQQMNLSLFITGSHENLDREAIKSRFFERRFTHQDLTEAVGDDKEKTICFVCGPPAMTDEVVEFMGGLVGKNRVFCEKWW